MATYTERRQRKRIGLTVVLSKTGEAHIRTRLSGWSEPRRMNVEKCPGM
jgi:hypothetical protein